MRDSELVTAAGVGGVGGGEVGMAAGGFGGVGGGSGVGAVVGGV